MPQSVENTTLLPMELTYVPLEQSKFGESDNESGSVDQDGIVTDFIQEADKDHSNNLRPRSNIQSSTMAQPVTFHDDDKPKLSPALRSINKDKWIAANNDEFDDLIRNNLQTDVQHRPPPNSEISIAWIFPRIKRFAYGNVLKYKAW